MCGKQGQSRDCPLEMGVGVCGPHLPPRPPHWLVYAGVHQGTQVPVVLVMYEDRKCKSLGGRPLQEPAGRAIQWPASLLHPHSCPVSSLGRGRGNQAAPSSAALASRGRRKPAAGVSATGGKKSLVSDLPPTDSHLLHTRLR